MPKDVSPYERDRREAPMIGEGVLPPPASGSTTRQKVILIAFFSIAAVVAIANRHAIVKAFEDPRTPEERAAAEVAADPNAPPTATCGDLGGWEICTSGVKRSPRVTDGVTGGYKAAKGMVFLWVTAKVTHSKKSARSTWRVTYALGDREGNRYSPDNDAMTAAMLDGVDTCGVLGDDINPGFAISCQVIFYVKKGTPGIYLVASERGKDLRLSLGE